MRALSAFFFIAILASSVGVRAAQKPDPTLDAPPAGLVPSQAKLSAILAKHDASVGAPPKTSVADWTFVDTGLAGTEHLVRSGTDYRSTVKTAASTEEYGQSGGKRWHRDAAGFTTASTADDERSFYVIRVTEDAADPKNDVSLAGETTGPNPAYVVKVLVSGDKHPEWIFFDKGSYDVVRVEDVVGKHRRASTFDDFRTTDGVRQAWHLHDFYYDPEYDDDYRMTAFSAGKPVAAGAFAQPSNPILPGVAARTKLPAQFFGGSAVLRVTIGGRGLDFDIDPTYRDSFIDYRVAKELGLPTYGQNTVTKEGHPIGYQTVIPDAAIGNIALHDFPVYATDVAWQPSDGTKVVGTLGYDFLAANIIHIDYDHQLVEAFPTSAFAPEPAKPVLNQLDLPMAFDDGTVLVPMQIGDGFTNDVALDPALPFTMVVGDFAEKHTTGDSTQKTSAFVPFADNASYGKTVDIWIAQMSEMAFANLNVTGLKVVATGESPGQNIDAYVGFDYLQFYDIYYDYPHDRLLLVPNDRFYKLTGKPKPHA